MEDSAEGQRRPGVGFTAPAARDMGNNERAAWLAGIYDNPAVRDHMTEVCLDLMTWASMRGRGDEARTWLMLHRTLKLSLIAWPVAARHGATVTVQPTTRKATS